MLIPLAALVLATNPYLPKAKRLYDALEYPAAELQLRMASQVNSSTLAERREAFDLLARTLAAEGKFTEAEEAYVDLLSKDPAAPAPEDAAPKIRDAYLRAKRRLYPPGFAKLARTESTDELGINVVDPWGQIATLQAHVARGGGPYQPETLAPAPYVVLAFPATEPRPIRLYVEARDASGKVIAQLGSEAAPVVLGAALAAPAVSSTPAAAPQLEAVKPESPPRASHVAAYSLGGLAAAGAAAGTYFALASASDSRAAGAARIAKDQRTLDDQAHSKAVAANLLVGGALLSAVTAGVLVWRW